MKCTESLRMAKENKGDYFSCLLHAFDALSATGYLHVLEHETQSCGMDP